MTITEAGILVQNLADKVTSEIQIAEDSLKELYDGIRRHIRIGSFCHHSYTWLSEFMEHMGRVHPDIRFRLVYIDDASLTSIGSKVDMVITSLPMAGKSYTYNELFQDKLVVAVSPGHRFAGKEVLSAVEILRDHVYYFFDESSPVYRYYIAPLDTAHKKHFTRVPHLGAALSMVRAGRGITFLPEWVLKQTAPDLLGVSPAEGGYGLTWHAVSQATNDPVQQTVLDEMVLFTRRLSDKSGSPLCKGLEG